MRIPVHTQTEEVAGGRSATSAQPRARHAVLYATTFLLAHATSQLTRLLPLEQPARLRRASVAARFPPAPRNAKGLWENLHRNPRNSR